MFSGPGRVLPTPNGRAPHRKPSRAPREKKTFSRSALLFRKRFDARAAPAPQTLPHAAVVIDVD
jgi:hypothetical protein